MYRIVSIHDLLSEHSLDSLTIYSFLLFPPQGWLWGGNMTVVCRSGTGGEFAVCPR